MVARRAILLALAAAALGSSLHADRARAATPFDQRAGVAFRIGGVRYGDDSAHWQAQFGPWDASHPHPRIISLYYRWDQLEPRPGVWNWGKLAASYADARRHGYFIILRVVTGRYAPSWIYTAGGVPSVRLWVPSTGSYSLRFPVVWTKPYRHLITLLARQIGAQLATTYTGSTATWSDYTAGVPIAAASDDGTEMPFHGAIFYNRKSRTVWDTVTPTPPPGETKQQLRASLTAHAWRLGAAHYLDAIPNAPVLLALGQVFKDSASHAMEMAQTMFDGTHAGHLVGMHTDFIPADGPDSDGNRVPVGPWSQELPKDASQLATIRSLGGSIAEQSASFAGETAHSYRHTFTDPVVAFTWAMRQDLEPNWSQFRFFEVSGGFGNTTIRDLLLNDVQPFLLAAHR
jgi:hypothetical protein